MSRLGPIKRDLVINVAVIGAFAALPFFVQERYLLGQVVVFFIWAMVATQWNLIMGHAGVFSLAQMLFFACGAYGVAMIVTFLGWPIWLAVPGAVVVATIFALLVGMACLRLTGAYVALLTLSIAEVFHILIVTETECFTMIRNNCQQLFGGSTGFSRFDGFGFRPILKGDWILGNYYVVLAVLGVSLAATIVVVRGRLGLAFRALRDNVGYATSRGIERRKYQVIAFAVSAGLTALAGGVYAGHYQFAGPSLFDFSTLVFVLAMIVVGGLGSIWGPLIGAAVIMVTVEFAKELGDARNLLLGLSLIVFVIVLPNGLADGMARLASRFTRRGRTKAAREGAQ